MGELFGITGDGWIAISTFASAAAIVLGIVYGARQFLREQEARDVRRYLIEEGAWKLQGSLERLLQTIRQNHVMAHHLVRIVRDLPRGHPGVPSVEDLPRLLILEPAALTFDAIRPASRLLDCGELGALVTSAFATLYNVHTILHFEVEQSVRTYYSSDVLASQVDHQSLVKSLQDLIEGQHQKAEKFGELPGWLEDAGLRAQELRISKFTDISRVQNDETIKGLADKIGDLWKELQAAEADSK